MERLNNYLCESFDSLAATVFVVLSLAVLDCASGLVIICSAGAEPPLILRLSGETHIVDTQGTPLGVFARGRYEAVQVQLGPGDQLLCFTDGLTEARNGTDYLGYERFQQLVVASRGAGNPRRVGEAIIRGVKAFTSGGLTDDACLVIAQRR